MFQKNESSLTPQEKLTELRKLLAAYDEELTYEDRTIRQELLSYKKKVDELEEEFIKTQSLEKIPNVPGSRYNISYYDMNSEPISYFEWSVCFESNRLVLTDIISGYRINTIWMGINYQIFPHQGILIFETCIFKIGADFQYSDHITEYMERYGTIEEAKIGHELACQFVRDNT